MTSQPDAPRSTTPSVEPVPRGLVLGRLDRVRSRVPDAPRRPSTWCRAWPRSVDADYFPVVGHGPITDISLTAWGWVHLLGGVVLIVAGLCLFAGQIWARTVGVLVAAASLIRSFGFLGAYPALSLVMIALGVVVILALTVHGSDIKP